MNRTNILLLVALGLSLVGCGGSNAEAVCGSAEDCSDTIASDTCTDDLEAAIDNGTIEETTVDACATCVDDSEDTCVECDDACNGLYQSLGALGGAR